MCYYAVWPIDSRVSWAWIKGVLERFMTHFWEDLENPLSCHLVVFDFGIGFGGHLGFWCLSNHYIYLCVIPFFFFFFFFVKQSFIFPPLAFHDLEISSTHGMGFSPIPQNSKSSTSENIQNIYKCSQHH